MEDWKPVVGYEGLYEVSSLGRVRRLDTMVEMPPSRRHPDGWVRTVRGGVLRPGRFMRTSNTHYLSVALCREGRQRSFGVHILVCAAFHGPKPFPKAEVRHLDGDGTNNVTDNLCWGTRSENMQDIIRHGRNVNGNKTVCKRGHPFVPGSYDLHSKGGRRCTACRKVRGN